MPKPKILLLIFTLLFWDIANGQIITRFAGNDTLGGYSGDGGAATTALLNYPLFARPDNFGNIYIADINNNRIRKVNTSGIITTIAGNGTNNHSGDGGQATIAGIANIQGVAIDNTGNIYIAEDSIQITGLIKGAYIRKVEPDGIISTIAGNMTYGYGGDGGPATAAGFQSVYDVAIDVIGNIYISDPANSRIRKINTSGIITTFAGNGTHGYSGDNGPAISAQLNNPYSIAIDSTGNIYIADFNNNCVRKVNTSGVITTIAGNGMPGYSGDGGLATAAELHDAGGIDVDDAGDIYISDAGNNRIRKVDASGVITTIAGNGTEGYSGNGEPATVSELHNPVDVAIDAEGNIYITDAGNNNIRKITAPNSGIYSSKIAKADNLILVLPNPTTGSFTLTLPSPTNELTQIVITNIIGQKIKELTTTNKEAQITLDAPPGMYFITVITKQGRQSAKVVVQ